MTDCNENRLRYIEEKGVGWRVAADGLRVDPYSRAGIADYLAAAWALFLEQKTEIAAQWAENFLAVEPESAYYRLWRETR